jgi:membrane-bound lytic murein transglycosylase A
MLRKIPRAVLILIFLVVVTTATFAWYRWASRQVEITQPAPPPRWTAESALRISPVVPEISDDGDAQLLLQAVSQSLEAHSKFRPERHTSFGPTRINGERLKRSLEDFRSKLQEYGLTEAFYNYVEKNYEFYRSSADEVLFTGYYEANLRGSRTRSEKYYYPLYKVPEDLHVIDLEKFLPKEKYPDVPKTLVGRVENRRVVPYYSRTEIDDGQKLSGKELEIVWVDSHLDAFFLQIQGSGIVTMDDGSIIRVNYAERNGHAYRAIGNVLIQRGIFTREQLSMQTLRKYLEEHPEEASEILNYNQSYVFFREVDKGPIGSIGVPLTAGRSLATDSGLFPDAALMFVETTVPVVTGTERTGTRTMKRFVLNQDTGGAIKGPHRADFFTGSNESARQLAGYFQEKGTFYFLLLRE